MLEEEESLFRWDTPQAPARSGQDGHVQARAAVARMKFAVNSPAISIASKQDILLCDHMCRSRVPASRGRNGPDE